MKHLLVITALIACGTLPVGSASAQVPLPARALDSLRGNAAAAQRNAAVYQWKRVSLEVARVAADEREVEVSFAGGTPPPAAATLRSAVLDLRAAFTAHDSERTQRAAHAVAAASETLRGL